MWIGGHMPKDMRVEVPRAVSGIVKDLECLDCVQEISPEPTEEGVYGYRIRVGIIRVAKAGENRRITCVIDKRNPDNIACIKQLEAKYEITIIRFYAKQEEELQAARVAE